MLPSGIAHAEVPHLIRYQGQAVDANDVPLEGPYTLIFRLYDAETAGNKIWEETQPNVQISGGHFSVLLGQIALLDGMDWTQPRWLSIQVNVDPELAPRQRITSVPLAIRAQTAEVVKTSGLTDDDNRLVPSGAIILWDGTGCPAGYSRITALDGKFLVADATYNAAAGGSLTHTHGAGNYAGPSHTHSFNGTTGVETQPAADGNGGPMGADDRHTHPFSGTTGSGGSGAVTGTSASADSRPPYATILLCKKN